MKNIFYPKQINKTKIKVFENQCFFAMPFSSEYTNLYDTLVLYMEKEGYHCIRVDNNLSASVPIINLILNGLATSQYVIVDISETNANVFYELGITHTIKDYDNVFILKEKSADSPFDIQHLQHIPYDKNNLKSLAIELLKRLKANQYKNSFKKAISLKQLIKYDDIDEFTDYFSKQFDENQVSIYTTLLSEPSEAINPNKEIIQAVWKYDEILQKEIKIPESDIYIPVLFRLYFEILLSSYRIDEVQQYIGEFLSFKQYSSLNASSLLSYQTDLAIKFAENSKLIDITVNWIIGYFQRSKSTKVDLNRYKLEAFLLKSESEKVNEYITNATVSDNHYIREHMSDIIGEKKLLLAENNLIAQLKREDNIYTVASLVEALGKIKSKKSMATINEWLDKNALAIIEKENFFVLKHFRNAIIRLELPNELEKFDEKYLELLLKNNAISTI